MLLFVNPSKPGTLGDYLPPNLKEDPAPKITSPQIKLRI